MKITTSFATALVASLLGAGSVEATICTTPFGSVSGMFSASPDLTPAQTSDVACLASPDSPFGWNNSAVSGATGLDIFTTSADLTSTSIVITMYTGATGGFGADAVWTLSLPNGAIFDSIELLSSDFRFDAISPDSSDTLSFTGVGSSSAIFTILGQDGTNVYDVATNFLGTFNITVSQANVVPEPAGFLLALTSLGILGAVRRRQISLRDA